LQLNNLQTNNPDIDDRLVFDELLPDIKKYFLESSPNANSSDLWVRRMEKSKNLFLKKNELNKDFFRNFRSIRKRLIADTPKSRNFFENFFYRHDVEQAKFQFRKVLSEDGFSKSTMLKTMEKFKFDLVGNPGYIIDSNYIYSERYIRHCYYINLFENFISPKLKRERYFLFDIGGGYGIFDNFILKLDKKIKPIIVDFPEQLFTASYYLKMNNPDIKINNISECMNTKVISKEYLDNFDACLIPAEKFQNIKVNENIIITNFNSFGEISIKVLNEYQNSYAFSNLDFIFTHNRLDAFPTYEDKVSIFDYKLERYNCILKEMSPIHDYVYQKKGLFSLKKVPFGSRCFTYIGSSKNINEI
tara:strand:+ start:1840 stop:2919 length:1080 start_codon:yes stop_codon:yes gene_type:complete